MTVSARSAVLLLAVTLVALVGVSTCASRTAARFERERDSARDSLTAEREDQARLHAIVAAATRHADSVTERLEDVTARARTHATRATALAARVVTLEAQVPDTATVVPREIYETAREAADEWRVAYLIDHALVEESGRTTALLRGALDSVTAQLARSAPRLQTVDRFVAKAEPPCRWLLFPCLTRTQTAVVSIAGTVIALQYGDEIAEAVRDGLRRIR